MDLRCHHVAGQPDHGDRSSIAMLILGALFWTTTAGGIPPTPPVVTPVGGHGRRDLSPYNSYNLNIIMTILAVLDEQ